MSTVVLVGLIALAHAGVVVNEVRRWRGRHILIL